MECGAVTSTPPNENERTSKKGLNLIVEKQKLFLNNGVLGSLGTMKAALT